MTQTLVPIFVCVVLPIAIVLIVSLAKMNADNKRTQIILKAIEANRDVDTEKLIESMKKPEKTALQILNLRLLRSCIFSLVGLGLVIVAVVGLLNDVPFADDPVSVPLVFGSASLTVGLSYLIVYFVTRRQLKSSEND